MFCKDILANLPPNGDLYTSHFHVLDNLFQQELIEERLEFDTTTQEQIDELYEQVERNNVLASDPITRASQWTSLLEIQQNEKGVYISQYDSIIEPWEILVYSGGHETQDGKYNVADTLSAALIVLRILRKDMSPQELHLVRYSSDKATGRYAFGIFLHKEITTEEVRQTVNEWGVETTEGIFFPVSKNILAGEQSLQTADFWSYEEALDFAWDHTKKAHKKKLEIIEKEERQDDTINEEENIKLPPIKMVKRPPRQIHSTGEYLYLVFVLGGSFIVVSFYVRRYLKEKRTIRKAIEERKKKEEEEF